MHFASSLAAAPSIHDQPRSDCPIHTALDLLGDRWSLLVIRDMMFAGKRHFREFLQSEEGISSNILADRLATLVASGILTKAEDPTHKQKAVYSLTDRGIGLLPVLTALSAWSQQQFAHTRRPEAVALVEGGAATQKKMAAALRRQHLP
ncbi:helix-turn-helix domain-containing protein [Ramlibacter sp.]|uniref:winged helix-turn-helix transcriptional regulator n=1 Tax=Ramlibacter sp. TaxID=1917967 RepID=UPI0025FAA4AF|nr:helix-turn-helix domain-containing protein [Ramlibacter sp.]